MRFAGANATAGETRTVIRSPAPTGMVEVKRRTPKRIDRAVIASPSATRVALNLAGKPRRPARFRRPSRHASTVCASHEPQVSLKKKAPFLEVPCGLGGLSMSRRRAPFVIALPFVMLAVPTFQAQAPHGDDAHNEGANGSQWINQYREPAARLIGEAMGSTVAWQRLSVLTDTIGNRLSGSPALEKATKWAAEEMKRDGLENVRTERVMVPRWIRGA